MTVNATGEITACCRDAGKRLTLGKLANGTLSSIWEGEKLKNARYLHENKRANEIEACNGCDHIRGHIVNK